MEVDQKVFEKLSEWASLTCCVCSGNFNITKDRIKFSQWEIFWCPYCGQALEVTRKVTQK